MYLHRFSPFGEMTNEVDERISISEWLFLKVHVGEEYANGINGNRYHFREGALDNGHNETSNKCFCRKGRCLPSGLVDVTDCYYGTNFLTLISCITYFILT